MLYKTFLLILSFAIIPPAFSSVQQLMLEFTDDPTPEKGKLVVAFSVQDVVNHGYKYLKDWYNPVRGRTEQHSLKPFLISSDGRALIKQTIDALNNQKIPLLDKGNLALSFSRDWTNSDGNKSRIVDFMKIVFYAHLDFEKEKRQQGRITRL